MPEHPPVYPVIAWAKEQDGLRTDAMPATATFLSERGLFLTARHVIELADDPTALRVFFHDDKRFIVEPFLWELHPELDVAACVTGVPEGFLSKRFVIGLDVLAYDEDVWTIGYGEYVAVEHEGATAGSKGLMTCLPKVGPLGDTKLHLSAQPGETRCGRASSPKSRWFGSSARRTGRRLPT